jgi:diaminopimelate epimerase
MDVTGVRIIKGHATENDFVIIDDRDGELELTADFVRALCDRHAGIGGDGVLRVVRSANDRAAASMAAETDFFMDYRNADGSVAEMCGNGVRLFLRYLQWAGLAGERAAVATRGGVRHVWSELDGSITVAMGHATVLPDRPSVRVRGGSAAWVGTAVQVPNPHVVVALPAGAELARLDLTVAPDVEPARSDGQNVEFVQSLGPRHLALRVHERGVGETRSCGTGICAAVVSSSAAGPDGTSWRVDVPGGTCTVRWNADGELWLTGPAELVGVVELGEHWLAAVRTQQSQAATVIS